MTDTAAAPPDALLNQWRDDLGSWAIPDEILAQAEEMPWVHPVAMFTVDDAIPDSPSHRIAREAVPEGGSVLDIGSGGGRASMALVPPAGTLIAVDHQQGMLDAFADAAKRRGVTSREFLGDWPAVADDVPEADVVVCHHVAYNVADIGPFLAALNDHARARVVLEVPTVHPQSNMNPMWKRFWNIDRPTRPTAGQLGDIAREMGFDAQVDIWADETWGNRVEMSQEDRIRFSRIRLCLTEDRDAEIAAALLEETDAAPRELATIWWDVER